MIGPYIFKPCNRRLHLANQNSIALSIIFFSSSYFSWFCVLCMRLINPSTEYPVSLPSAFAFTSFLGAPTSQKKPRWMIYVLLTKIISFISLQIWTKKEMLRSDKNPSRHTIFSAPSRIRLKDFQISSLFNLHILENISSITDSTSSIITRLYVFVSSLTL